MSFEIVNATEDATFVSPKALAEMFHVTLEEVAGMTGIPKTSLQRPDRFKNIKTQIKLKDTLEIIRMITPWAGSTLQAYAWYRSEPIPAFGNITIESVVKLGMATQAKNYIQSIALGGYA